MVASRLGYEKKRSIKKNVPYNTRKYQFELLELNIKPSDSVLDIGSGAHPFKYGTFQLDLYHDDNFHRGGRNLAKDSRPNIVADIECMPFSDKQFDFAYCSHVLEHVPNPAKACREIIRVAKRGYIETPTRLSDIMSDITYLHTWHVSMIGHCLIFIPYTEREKKGTGVKTFEADMHSPFQNDFSSMVYRNRDIFCNMMMWEDTFDYFIFDRAGNLVDSSK